MVLRGHAERGAGTRGRRLPMLRHNAWRECQETDQRLAGVGPAVGVRRRGGGPCTRRDHVRRGGGGTSSAPEGRRHAEARGPLRQGRGAARPAGDPAGLRRDGGRPLSRPGLRPGAGPVLRDGLPPACNCRPAQRAARREHGGDRPVHPDDGLAPGGRARVRPARPVHPGLPERLQRRGERLPEGALGHRAVGGVHRAGTDRPRLRAGGVDAGRLARLAQGDGVGPAREHGRGDRAHPALGRPHPGAGRRALSPLPLPAPRPDRRPDRCGAIRRSCRAARPSVPPLSRRSTRCSAASRRSPT